MASLAMNSPWRSRNRVKELPPSGFPGCLRGPEHCALASRRLDDGFKSFKGLGKQLLRAFKAVRCQSQHLQFFRKASPLGEMNVLPFTMTKS